MTRPQLTPPTGVLVAIDVAKARNEVLIEVPGSGRRRRLNVLNTRAEHDRLIALLSDLGQPVTCGFEATGNYHRPIAWRLLQAGFAVRLISSVGLARTREALHNGWDKNDPKDAQVMPHMIRIGASQVYHDTWLRALTVWSDHCDRLSRDRWLQLEWAAVAPRAVPRGQEEDLHDGCRPRARGSPRPAALGSCLRSALDLRASPGWDYVPGGPSEPFEYKASDWGYLDGRSVALDYAAPALDQACEA